MKRITLITAIFAISVAVCAAQNKAEVNLLKQFLRLPSVHGQTNYAHLGINIDNPSSWAGVEWGADGHVTTIDWHDKKISGELNLSGFKSLTSVNVAHNNLTKIDLTGCTSLKTKQK